MNLGGVVSKEEWKSGNLAEVKACGDCNEPWEAWWNEALDVLWTHPDGPGTLEDKLQYIKDCQDAAIRDAKGLSKLTHPGKYLVKAVLEYARSSAVQLPECPSRKVARTSDGGQNGRATAPP